MQKYPVILPQLDDGLNEANNSDYCPTTHAQFYKCSSAFTNDKTILIVDTPGFNNINRDDEAIEIINNAASRVSFFNAIVYFQKSSTNRLLPCIEYCLYIAAKIIPRDFESSIVAAFTFNQGFIEFEEEWFPFKIQHKIKLQNDAFVYSTSEYQAKPKRLNCATEKWNRSIKRYIKFLAKLFTMPKVATTQFNSHMKHNN
jgi:hypothetical protein